jgi:PAS domain S-box-containing protein
MKDEMPKSDITKGKSSVKLRNSRRAATPEVLDNQPRAEKKTTHFGDEGIYKAIFESANDSIFLVDKKGKILDFNSRLIEIGGYEKEELIGKNIRSLTGMVTKKSLVIMIANFLKRMANIHVSPYEVEMYKKNGELVTVEISARPLRKDGKIIGDLAILRDVTERKRIENEIRLKSSEIELINSINDAANRGLSLTELIQAVSEEIQNLYGGFAAITYFLSKDKQYLVAKNYKFPSRLVNAIEKTIHMKMSDINFRLKEGSIHSETIKTGKVRVTNDVYEIQQMSEEYSDDKTLRKILPMVVKIMGLRSVISVPLVSEGEAIGLLDIARHEPLMDCDLERMQNIASQFVNVIKRKQAEDALKESETRHHELVNTITSGVFIYKAVDNGEDFVFVDLNSAAEKMEGINRKDIIGKRITEVLPEAKEFYLFKVFQNVWQTGNSQYFSSGERKDEKDTGRWRDNWAYKLPSGEIVNVYNDITDKKLAEKALQVSEEKYRLIVENSQDLIFTENASGEIIYMSPSIKNVLGYNQADIISRSFRSIIHPDDIRGLEEAVKRNITDGYQSPGGIEFRVRHISGEWRWYIGRGSAVHDANGNFINFIGIVNDISKRKQAEEALKQSEEKYRTIFESANDILMLLDTNGMILDVNGRLTDIGGYDRFELINKNILELGHIIDEKNMAVVVGNLQKIVGSRATVTYQVEMVKKNREPISMEISAVPILKEDKVVGVLGILRDITERNKSESRVKEQKALTDRILSSTPNAVAVVGQDQRIIMVNKAFEVTFELAQGEAEGKEIREIIPIPVFLEKIEQVLGNDQSQFQIEFRFKKGAVESVLVAHIISTQKNEVLVMLHDITEEREIQERLYLTDRLASLGEMAAGIAHELNNPLTGVVALSQLLLESGVPDGIKEDLESISSEGQRAASVVKNLLSFTRSHTLSAQPVEINGVIDQVLKLRAYEHRVNNIEVVVHLAPNLPEITADRFQLQQVFINIVLNAEQAMIESHKRGNLTVSTEQLCDNIKISFSDDGPGIPQDILNRIFDPFFTTKEVGKGTGLGLSICYGIVTKQGGRIYAESQPGNGATFVVELPVAAF